MPVSKRFRTRSPQFRHLEIELHRLRTHMLPRKPSPTGVYRESVVSRTFGYRVLAHAEFEYYFEERAKEICIWCIKSWKRDSKASKSLSTLMSYYGYEMESPKHSKGVIAAADKSRWLSDISFDSRINRASRLFHQAISVNHGVKEHNIVQMLLPMGIDYDDLDAAWLAAIDSFAQDRGSVAHVSGSVNRLGSVPDPFTAIHTVENVLLPGAKEIDALINSLKR